MIDGPPSAEVAALQRRLFQLETLYEIGRECTRARSVDEVLRVVLTTVMGAFGATSGLTYLAEGGHILTAFSRGLGLDAAGAARAARSHLEAADLASVLRESHHFEVDGLRGAIVLGDRLGGGEYAAEERELARAIVANAVPYVQRTRLLDALSATAEELRRRAAVLAAANDIVLGLAERPTAARLHRTLLSRVATTIDAAEAALALSDETGWRIATTLPDDAPHPPILERLRASGSSPSLASERDALVPVREGAGIRAALWLRRADDVAPFDDADRASLSFLANQVGAILERSRLFEEFLLQQREQFRLRGVLEQYLAPSVAERLISGETRPALEGTRLTASVLMVDMRGSSELTLRVGAETMVRMLNQYFERMTDAFFAYEGTIDKFEGDALIGFFGAPERHDDDPLRALRTGAAMQRSFELLRESWVREYDLPPSVGIGVGIATGEVVIGNIGSAKRLDHTVIGAAANLAARLASLAPRGAIQVDGETWNEIVGALSRTGRRRRPRRLRAKGFGAPLPVYRLSVGDIPD